MDFISCPLRNFSCQDSQGMLEIYKNHMKNFYILKQDIALFNVIKGYRFVEIFGLDTVAYYHENYVAYTQANSLLTRDKRCIAVNNLYVECQLFSNALWFVKDNAVTPYMTTICSNEPIEPVCLRRSIYYTNSEGLFSEVDFSIDELNKAMEWYSILDQFTIKKKGNSIDLTKDLMNMSNYLSFDVPSFQRIYYYLDNARNTEFLPSKISSYISILECVVAAKGENVQKVSERIAYFIGENADERLKIYEDIKKIYDLRSCYVHGSQISSKKHSTLSEVSQRADEIVRKVLSLLFKEHKDLNYSNKKDKNNPDSKTNEDVDRWFNELVFRRE